MSKRYKEKLLVVTKHVNFPISNFASKKFVRSNRTRYKGDPVY